MIHPSSPHAFILFLEPFHFLRPAGDQLVAEGVTHISLPLHKNTIGGGGARRK